MNTAKLIILWLALAFALILPAPALTPTAPENRVREIFSIGYDSAIAEVTDLGSRTETSTSNYDTAPIHGADGEHRLALGTCYLFGQNAEFKAAEGDALAGARPPNLSPDGAGRTGALRQALRDNGVPTSQQPSRVLQNLDRRGNVQPGRSYEYEIPAPGGGTLKVIIRDDAGGHDYGPGNAQNRGPHFNDESGNHYDY